MSDIIERINNLTTLLEGKYGAFDDTISWTINQQFYKVFSKDMKGKRFTPESAEQLFANHYPKGFDPIEGGPKIMPGDILHADWKALSNYWNGGAVMSRNKKMNEDVSIPARIRSKINDKLHDISRHYHKSIPLADIFNALKAQEVLPVQEDGSEWEGLLSGKEGRATIDLVSNGEQKIPFKSSLVLSWYKMPSGNYEINAYLS